MTYVRKQKTIRLDFDESHEWAGLVVRTRALTTGTFLEVTELGVLFADSKKGAGKAKVKASDMGKIGRLFTIFADALLDWTLEEEDDKGKVRKVPASLAGVKSQDVDFVMELIGEWIGQVAGMDADLGKDSTSGGTSLELSIPMAPRSPSPRNSAVPA